MRYPIGLLAAFAIAAMSAHPASAQVRAPQRGHSTWFNAGLGWGGMTCPECDGRANGISGTMSLGRTPGQNARLGAGITVWMGRVEENEAGFSGHGSQMVAILGPIARIYPSAKHGPYVLAGIGAGVRSRGIASFAAGPALTFGVGLDLAPDRSGFTPFANFNYLSADGRTTLLQLGLSVTIP